MTAQTILPANTLSSGYDVANSCMFDRASTDSMSKSMSDGSSIKGTFSAWIKVDGTGNEMNILSHFQDTNNVFTIATSGAGVSVIDYNSGYSSQLQTNRLMRDPSAWFHLYIAIDRSQGTADLRNRMFINGVEQTSFSSRTNPSQQTSGSHQDAFSMNDGQCTMYLGGLGDGNQMFGGYMAEVVWLDGTVSAVTNFGEFDEDSGIWKPIDVSELSSSKGTNGFYLDFEDASNLGNDVFGGTDLTESNIASTNQSTDTCTNNFCVINPLVNGTQTNSRNPTLSEGNTFLTNTSGAWMNCFSSFAVDSGKWYFEAKVTKHGTSYAHLGIYSVTQWENEASGWPNFGDPSSSFSYDGDGNIVNSGSNANTDPATYTTNDIIGIAVDLDNNKFYAYKNNSLQVSGGTNITADTEYYLGGMGYNYNIAFNFGNPSYANSSDAADAEGFGAFEFAPPSGFYSLCSKNLAEYG